MSNDMPSKIKMVLIKKAREKYNEIEKCRNLPWKKCFTNEMGRDIFWFNTADGSTHMVCEINNDAQKV